VKKSFNIPKLLHHKSKPHGTKPYAPLLVKSFPKTPRTQSEASQFFESHNYKTKQTTLEHDLKHPSSVNLITTKQNKLP
jgi:hypothetical protein